MSPDVPDPKRIKMDTESNRAGRVRPQTSLPSEERKERKKKGGRKER